MTIPRQEENVPATPSAGEDPDELLYQSDHTRVFRLHLTNRRQHVICKEPLGADALGRLRHERRMLERLAGIAGVPQLAKGGAPANSIALEDSAFVALLDAMQARRLDLPEL